MRHLAEYNAVKVVKKRLGERRVSLHDERGQMQDIADYIRSSVNIDRNTERWRAEDKELVIETVTKKTGEMFRWVSCQVDYLRRRLRACVLHALEELPESLDATYEHILRDIDERAGNLHNVSCRMFQWHPTHFRFEELAEFSRV